MKRLYMSARYLPALGLALALSGCGTQSPAAQPTAIPAATAAPAPSATPVAQPTAAPAATALPAPTSAPKPTAQPANLPELYYLDQNAVFAHAIGGAAHQIATFDGAVLGTALSGDTLLVLRDSGIERVHLPDGAATNVLAFKSPAQPSSSLLATSDGRIFYAARVEDPNAVFGKTMIGVYDVASGAMTPLQTVDGAARPLGLTPDGKGLYVLPVGGDPSFAQVRVIDAASGADRAELAVEGEGAPVVSPDGRMLAVTARRFSASDPNAEPDSLVYLYDLTQQPVTRTEIVPPQAPSAANNLFWSPDSRALYFSLGAGNIYELKQSYGLWVYDIASGKASKLSDVDVLNTFVTNGASGSVVLLRHTTSSGSALIDLATGAPTPFDIAPSAMVAGWR